MAIDYVSQLKVFFNFFLVLGRIHRSNGHHGLVEMAVWIDDVPSTNLVTCSIDKQIIGWRVQLNNKN